MDFLDSLDLDVSNKRSRRVRSWYLYEQFKTLERNQRDATQKLKDKSFQESVLRQELSERKARRNLYDQFGLRHSECTIERSVKSEGGRTALSASIDDFYESFCDLQDVRPTDVPDDVSEACSHNEKCGEDDFKSVDDRKGNTCYAESVNSVVNVKSEETVTEDIEEEYTVVEEMNLCFDEVKENLERIEKLTELDTVEVLENDVRLIEESDVPHVVMKDKNVDTSCDNNIFAIWAKLVSFAHQIVQLNHGNCYVDYGSQLLTAVLACDVLCRGINRMCHILQPYVSPIKFADDSNTSTDSYKCVKRKKKSRQRYRNTETLQNCTKHQITRKPRSENCWQHCSGCTTDNQKIEQKDRGVSEPWHTPKFTLNKGKPSMPSKSSYSSIWPDFSNDDSIEYFLRDCHCKTLNPMLKLSQYFDSVLKEIDDSLNV